jgi:hypothetical protein
MKTSSTVLAVTMAACLSSTSALAAGRLIGVRTVERQRSHSLIGPYGGTRQRSVTFNHQPGLTTRQVTGSATGPNGGSISRSVNASHQAGVGSSREATVSAQGPRGAELSRSVDYSHQPGGSVSRTVTTQGTTAGGASFSDTHSRSREIRAAPSN